MLDKWSGRGRKVVDNSKQAFFFQLEQNEHDLKDCFVHPQFIDGFVNLSS
jgi:hypothetical protein